MEIQVKEKKNENEFVTRAWGGVQYVYKTGYVILLW